VIRTLRPPLFSDARAVRVITLLRRKFPGRWTYNARRFPRWQHEDGWGVEAYAELAPRYDGDDDTFTTVYRRTDTREVVYL